MYLSVILVVALDYQFAMALTHTSALMKRVQAVPSGSSPGKRIACALELTKSAYHIGAKIAGGTDSCELLYMSQLTNVGLGYESFEKTTVLDNYIPPGNIKERVLHILFAEVKVGDKFQFVFQKSNTDTFAIAFKDTSKATILSLEALAKTLALKAGYGNDYGEVEKPQYPFSDFKEYKILFQILETQWQIDIDDVPFTTFDHRIPVNQIKKIIVKVGPSVTYLTKASDPRLPE